MSIIEVENLSKSYAIGNKEAYGSLREEIMQTITAPFKRLFLPNKSNLTPNTGSSDADSTLWALKDVSFSVNEGEVVGIIGRNGAGKSTLLKIMSRITEPTAGRIVLKGRMASLLEVGTGFHPELTGRENIFLNGALLGMGQAEIRSKFDEIVAFSEIEKFLDTPVKRYSSGMYVRLAFAVAAHLDPEILIIDEVLAVGDAQFQKKCLGKMGDAAKGGRTVLFVSHNMGAIKSLCTSALFMAGGSVVVKGFTNDVAEKYLMSASDEGGSKGEVYWPDKASAPGGKEMRLISIRLLNENNEVQSTFDGDRPVRVEINYELFESLRGMELSLQLINSDGVVVFTSTDYDQRETECGSGLYRSICTIPGGLLNSGSYFIKINSNIPFVKVLVSGWEFVSFRSDRFLNHTTLSFHKWPGIVAPRLTWNRDWHKK